MARWTRPPEFPLGTLVDTPDGLRMVGLIPLSRPRRSGKVAEMIAAGRAADRLHVHWHRVGPGGLNECHNGPEGCTDGVA
jgi:hypothetical protein